MEKFKEYSFTSERLDEFLGHYVFLKVFLIFGGVQNHMYLTSGKVPLKEDLA